MVIRAASGLLIATVSATVLLAPTVGFSVGLLESWRSPGEIREMIEASRKAEEARRPAPYRQEMNQAPVGWKAAIDFATTRPPFRRITWMKDTAGSWSLETNRYEAHSFSTDESKRERLVSVGLGMDIVREQEDIQAFAHRWGNAPRNQFDAFVRLCELSMLPPSRGGLELGTVAARKNAEAQMARVALRLSPEQITVADAEKVFELVRIETADAEKRESDRVRQAELTARKNDWPRGHFK